MSASLKLRKEKDGKLTWENLVLHKGARCYLSAKVVISSEWSPGLGCIKSYVTRRSREVILPLCSHETPTCNAALGPQHKEDTDLLGLSPEEAVKMRRGIEHLSQGDRLRVGLVQCGEERAPGRPSCRLPVSKGDYKKNMALYWRRHLL